MSKLPKVAIQGARGSFHHAAAQRLLGTDKIELVFCENFSQVFQNLAKGTVDYGICAVENNLHGSINEVYRLLAKTDASITKDIRMHIHQQLIAASDVSLAVLRSRDDVRVLSQGPALAQVELWLDENLPSAIRVETHDTAASVASIVDSKATNEVAVAGEAAAKEYGGTIVCHDIEDDPNNFTRFVLLQDTPSFNQSVDHSSIILHTDHTPGSLLRALQVFEKHGSNLTKLDSHPIPGDQQHYAFYIDFEIKDANHATAITDELTSHGHQVKLLGLYEHIA